MYLVLGLLSLTRSGHGQPSIYVALGRRGQSVDEDAGPKDHAGYSQEIPHVS